MADRGGFEVSYVRDLHPPKTNDPTWLSAFASEGGHTMISGDPRILQHWPNIVAYIESGLVCFFPPPTFANLDGFTKAALVIRWWPFIIEKAKASNPGDCWRFPFLWTPDAAKFEKLEDPRFETEKQREEHGITKATRQSFRPGGGTD